VLLDFQFLSRARLAGNHDGRAERDTSCQDQSKSDADEVQKACSCSNATVLATWDLGRTNTSTDIHTAAAEDQQTQDASTSHSGIIMGCEDGSVFVFRSQNGSKQSSQSSETSPEVNPSITIEEAVGRRLMSSSPASARDYPPPLPPKFQAPEIRSRAVSINSSRTHPGAGGVTSQISSSRSQATAMISNEQATARGFRPGIRQT
jgi:hypothetical protein